MAAAPSDDLLRRSVATSLCGGGIVYFVTYGDLCKIGITKRWPRERLEGIQNMCPVPLTLAAVRPGHSKEERELHDRFADARRHGEWFQITDGITAQINASRSTFGPPDPEFGAPEYLYRLALADARQASDDRETQAARKQKLATLRNQVQELERSGEAVPGHLLASMYLLASHLFGPAKINPDDLRLNACK